MEFEDDENARSNPNDLEGRLQSEKEHSISYPKTTFGLGSPR